ncbi:hypothetical protein Pelo_17590 [Pelomyxa schiedti]|nr:hypothetical protein Pelo_17590 [Pelomyxa schiedti]
MSAAVTPREDMPLTPAWDINASITPGGWTMLHYACWFGHESLVGQLLGVVGASRDPLIDPNKTDRHGDTPLCLAAREGKEAVGFVEGVKVLLKVNGIETNCKNINGETPLDVAKRKNCTDICNLLTDHNARLQCSKPTINTPKNSNTFEVEMREKEREIARITVENKRLGDSLREMNERVLILSARKGEVGPDTRGGELCSQSMLQGVALSSPQYFN